MVLTPRQIELAQPKIWHNPSANDPVNNFYQDSRKPIFRSTRELFNKNGTPFRAGQAPGSERNGYHEQRFGWRSGYFTMWDTHPTGTKLDVRMARNEILEKSCFHRIPVRPHDDPSKIQLLPTAHTTSAKFYSPHTAWDARASKAWQDTVAAEQRAMRPRSKSSSPRNSMSSRTAKRAHLGSLAVATRPVPPPPRRAFAGQPAFLTISAPQPRFGKYMRQSVY
jgi:hypothetical protein